MRPSLRFLGVALFGWAGIRAATLGAIPGAEVFRVASSEAKTMPAPIVQTEFPPLEPVAPSIAALPPQFFGYGSGPQILPLRVQPITVPVVYASAPAAGALPPARPAGELMPDPGPAFYSRIPPLDEWPLSRIASASRAPRQTVAVAPLQSVPIAAQRLDRLQLTAWALLRERQAMVAGPESLATGGTLGGSQAGARLTYNVTRQVAASLRSTSDVNRRGFEVAGGVRVQPIGGIPLWLTAERRQRIGPPGTGRNAFALFAEGGVYGRPVAWQLVLDAYLQGGVVDVRRRDAFVDGGFTLTRPIFGRFSGGVGLWGGAQPGLYRIDAGPRLTMRLRDNVRVHLDWRQRMAGNALPGSGPAITLAGDF